MDSHRHRHHRPSRTSSLSSSRRRQGMGQLMCLSVLLVLIILVACVSAFLPHSPSRQLPLPLARRPFRSPHATTGGGNDGPTYFKWLGRQVELKLRPQPYQGLRLKIDKELAVLLMRSSYEIADELDFVAMNDFQKDFFTFRQAEWEDYVNTFPPLSVRQGELTQPSYFDFISFAQYCTLNEEMRHGKMVFVELISAEGEKQVVRRADDPSLPQDNALLPAEHARRVGRRILDKFLEAPEVYAPRVRGREGGNEGQVGDEEVVENVKRIMDLFTAKQYNQGGEVRVVEGGREGGTGMMKLQILSRAPANLWSLQSLLFRKEPLLNDFEGKAVMAYLKASGREVGRYGVEVQGTDVIYTFSI